MPHSTKTSDKWERFEEGGRGHRGHLPESPEGSSAWAVIWDDEPQIFFISHPNNWGGSGWYADPEDVISKPEVNTNVRKVSKMKAIAKDFDKFSTWVIPAYKDGVLINLGRLLIFLNVVIQITDWIF